MVHYGEVSFTATDQKVWSQPHSGEAGFAVADQKASLKNISLRSGEARFVAVDQKVWALCFCPPPLRFIKILKIIKVRMPKNKKIYVKQSRGMEIIRNEGKRESHNAWVASQEALCLTSLARHSCNEHVVI